MPDFAAHDLFGTQVLALLPPSAAGPLERSPAFRWGLQGPDPLYYRGVLLGGSPLPGWGALMHRSQTDRLFETAAGLVCRQPAGPARALTQAYLMGFLCHYLLDSAAHPYIFWRQQQLAAALPQTPPAALHCRVEADADMALYRLRAGQDVTRFRPSAACPLPGPLARLLGSFVARLLQQTYGLPAAPAQCAAAFAECARVVPLLYAPSDLPRRLAQGAEVLARRPGAFSSHFKWASWQDTGDVLNLACAPWHSPTRPQQTRTESLPQLMEAAAQAAPPALEHCRRMIAARQPEPFGFAVSFDNGDPERSEEETDENGREPEHTAY